MISIVVSIYNGERWLHRCIDSLLDQTADDYELILVDDGSTDSSGEICDAYARENGHVRVIHKENAGLSMARKTGWQSARGEYIMFLDCDDYVSPNLVERMQNAAAEGPDLILCDFVLVDAAGGEHPKQIEMPDQILERQDLDGYAAASIASGWNSSRDPYLAGFVWLRCVRRCVLREEMFISERLCYTEDVLFNLELSRRIRSFVYVREPLYYYCITPASLTNRHRRNMWQMLCYRRSWIRDFCTRENLWPLARERFEHCCWTEIIMAFQNACLADDCGEAIRQMRTIRNTPDTGAMLRSAAKAVRGAPMSDRLRHHLIRLRLYRVYYLLNRALQKRR